MLLDVSEMAGGAVRSVRGQLAQSVRGLVVGDAPPVRNLSQPVTGDPGLFGPHSVTWKVHADSAMFVGGLAALFHQTVHPLAMAGVAQHSAFRTDPLGRLARTAGYVGLTTYGTVEQATRTIAAVKQVHQRVIGTTADGEPYAANDPHLLTFVHHTLVDAFLRAYQRYGAGRLTAEEADAYVAEMAVLADLFEGEPAATSVAELTAWFEAEQPALRATGEARATTRFLLVPPLPLTARPSYGVIAAAAVGLLPGSVRRALWIPVLPLADPFVVRPAATVLLRTLDWVMGGLSFDEASPDHEEVPASARDGHGSAFDVDDLIDTDQVGGDQLSTMSSVAAKSRSELHSSGRLDGSGWSSASI